MTIYMLIIPCKLKHVISLYYTTYFSQFISIWNGLWTFEAL